MLCPVMEFSLVSDRRLLGRITNVQPDQPWFDGDFVPTADFEAVRPMFDRAAELLERESWGEWEAQWAAVRRAGIRLRRDDQPEEIAEFALYIDGEHCRFRY